MRTSLQAMKERKRQAMVKEHRRGKADQERKRVILGAIRRVTKVIKDIRERVEEARKGALQRVNKGVMKAWMKYTYQQRVHRYVQSK